LAEPCALEGKKGLRGILALPDAADEGDAIKTKLAGAGGVFGRDTTEGVDRAASLRAPALEDDLVLARRAPGTVVALGDGTEEGAEHGVSAAARAIMELLVGMTGGADGVTLGPAARETLAGLEVQATEPATEHDFGVRVEDDAGPVSLGHVVEETLVLLGSPIRLAEMEAGESGMEEFLDGATLSRDIGLWSGDEHEVGGSRFGWLG
jgi:hypothetical protein